MRNAANNIDPNQAIPFKGILRISYTITNDSFGYIAGTNII